MGFELAGELDRLEAIEVFDRMTEGLVILLLEVDLIKSLIDGSDVLLLGALKEWLNE